MERVCPSCESVLHYDREEVLFLCKGCTTKYLAQRGELETFYE